MQGVEELDEDQNDEIQEFISEKGVNESGLLAMELFSLKGTEDEIIHLEDELGKLG